MNLEKFTDRARGFLQSAQTVALRMNHQRIAPVHVLKALLEDEQGMASGLIARAGGLTWVQSPESAQVSTMPQAALAAGRHAVMDADTMGAMLAAWAASMAGPEAREA